MKNTQNKMLLLALAAGCGINAEVRVINSLKCAEAIPGAKQVMTDVEKLQKSKMAELKEIEGKAQKLMAELQKDRTDLLAKQTTLSADAKYKEEKKVQDKERKLQELQGDYQRIMHDLETEMQMAQMKLQPFIMEAIQNAQELAKNNAAIEAIWDEATNRMIYTKQSADLTSEVIKLTENKQKTTVAKPALTKAEAPKAAAPAKVA